MNIKVKIGDQAFEVEVGDLSARPILAVVDGETFEVWPEQEMTAPFAIEKPVTVPVARAAAPATPRPSPAVAAAVKPGAEGSMKTVSAPIPGSIISIAINPGDRVTKGQELCVLEAMKMKNVIRASRDGQIAVVHVSVGQTVQKGHPLIEYTD